MQVIWMVTVTLMLALGGVLALALVAHVGDRRRPPSRGGLRAEGRRDPGEGGVWVSPDPADLRSFKRGVS
jgi:hypothetical protein